MNDDRQIPDHAPLASAGRSRRGFLKLSAAAMGGAGAMGVGLGANASGEPVGSRVGASALRGGGRCKNVIMLVADGMSHATLMLADAVSRRTLGRASHFVTMRSDERTTVGQCMTHSRDSLVTDSAAAGSAYGIGEHIDNGAINWVDGRQPTPILVRAKRAGLATGVVSTTRLTHATPAAFSCNMESRGMEDEIAVQMLGRGFDLMLGGGTRHFPSDLLGRHGDLTVVKTRTELRTAVAAAGSPGSQGTGRLLGLFEDSHMKYELDRPGNQPSLSTMTSEAIAHLSKGPNGFLLQVEGGRIDHAGHGNDAAGIVHDQLAFDDAVRVAVEWVVGRDDTLLIVTTDHGTGAPQLTKYGEAGAIGIDLLARAKQSFEWIGGELGREWYREPGGRVREVVEAATGIALGDEDLSFMAAALSGDGRPGDGFREADGPTSVLSAVLANYNATAFVSSNHDADYVEVMATGPGSNRLGRFIDNVDLHRLMCEQLGLPLA